MASLSIGSNHTWISELKSSMLELEHLRPYESSTEYRRGPLSVQSSSSVIQRTSKRFYLVFR